MDYNFSNTPLRDLSALSGDTKAWSSITQDRAGNVAASTPDYYSQLSDLLKRYQTGQTNIANEATREQALRTAAPPAPGLEAASPSLQAGARSASASAMEPTIGGARAAIKEVSDLLDNIRDMRKSHEETQYKMHNEAKGVVDKILEQGVLPPGIDLKEIAQLEKTSGYPKGYVEAALKAGVGKRAPKYVKMTNPDTGEQYMVKVGGGGTQDEGAIPIPGTGSVGVEQRTTPPAEISDYSNILKGRTPQQQEAFGKLSPIQKSNVAQLINGDALLSDLVSTRGIQGGRQRQKLLQMARLVDPTFSENENKIRYEFNKKWQSSESVVGKNRVSINTALGHLAEVKTLVDSLKPSDIQYINTVKNWWNKETGNSNIVSLQFGISQLATEIAAVYKGTGAAPSEREIEDEKAILGINLSKGQFEGLFNTVSKFLSSKITASRYLYKSTMGHEYAQSVIDPDKRQALIDAGIDPNSIIQENADRQESAQNQPTGQNAPTTTKKGLPFDYAAAKKAGYSDTEIQEFINTH